jgi:hypothetical protein
MKDSKEHSELLHFWALSWSGILRNIMFRELNLLPSSGEEGVGGTYSDASITIHYKELNPLQTADFKHWTTYDARAVR